MDSSKDFADRLVRQQKLITAVIHLNYYQHPDDERKSRHAEDLLHAALDSLGNPAEAREVARTLAKQASRKSTLQQDLDDWWLTSLHAEKNISDTDTLGEILHGATSPAGTEELKDFTRKNLTGSKTGLDIIPALFRQLELQHPAEAQIRTALEDNASLAGQTTGTQALMPLLRGCYEYDLPQLKEAALRRLPEIDLPVLARWHQGIRHTEGMEDLRGELKAAYIQSLLQQTAVSPTQAWSELQGLENRWRLGQPTIVTAAEAPITAIFTACAANNPEIAAAAEAEHIRGAGSTDERLHTLEQTHLKVSSLSPTRQLSFLGHLHRHLWHEPDLASPSRDQILRLHEGHPGALNKDELRGLVMGDDVLSNILWPAVGVIPKRRTLRQQLAEWLRHTFRPV